jgi:hypothetical protein
VNVEARISAVWNLVHAARALYERRASYISEIALTTGLSPEGVDWGFGCLECDPSAEAVETLASFAETASHVHVILSAGVFVASLRALALARAAAPCVTIRPSSRDPWLTRALVEIAGDRAIRVIGERDISRIDADCVHVYGRRETIAAVRARARPGMRVHPHGPGLGAGIVTASASLERAARALAADIVTFDQRGCLSPRVVLIEGEGLRADAFGADLHRELGAWEARIPRGHLSSDEMEQARRWTDALCFGGRVWLAARHAIALGSSATTASLPPVGRHVLLVPIASMRQAQEALAPLSRYLTAIGSDDPEGVRVVVSKQVRVSALGQMQRPPLDGPVDRRTKNI